MIRLQCCFCTLAVSYTEVFFMLPERATADNLCILQFLLCLLFFHLFLFSNPVAALQVDLDADQREAVVHLFAAQPPSEMHRWVLHLRTSTLMCQTFNLASPFHGSFKFVIVRNSSHLGLQLSQCLAKSGTRGQLGWCVALVPHFTLPPCCPSVCQQESCLLAFVCHLSVQAGHRAAAVHHNHPVPAAGHHTGCRGCNQGDPLGFRVRV